MKTVTAYLSGFKKELKYGPFFKWLEAVFELIIPFVMAKIIDIGIGNNDIPFILYMGAIMFFLGVVGYISSLICQYYASKASQGYGTIVRDELYKHINKLSNEQLQSFGPNSLITRMTNDINQLQLAVAMLIRLVVRAPFLIIGATAMAMFIDWKLALLFLLIIPIIAVILYLVMSRTIPFYRTIQKKVDNLSLVTRQNLVGVRVIRAFSRQNDETEKFENASEAVMDASIRVGKMSALLNPLTYIVVNLGVLAIIWFGGIRVNIGDLSQGEVIAFINYMMQILMALIVVANLVVLFTRAYASAIRVSEVLETAPALTEPQIPVTDTTLSPDDKQIIFDNVGFTYPDAQLPMLHQLSFSVKKGETIGIIGGTGAGKSTLISLLPRLYDVTSGKILVDGIDVKDYAFKTLRKKVNIIPQKAVVFTGTIADNLRWGKLDATDAEVWDALETAQAKDFVERLDEGLETKLYQGGKNLSGGQKQRLTIARALVAQPEILIFDDSSSALDYVTDVAMRGALKDKLKETTIIAISQRINAIRYSDKIIVLSHGEIRGIGTHETLLETCDLYKEIALSQLSEEEVQR